MEMILVTFFISFLGCVLSADNVTDDVERVKFKSGDALHVLYPSNRFLQVWKTNLDGENQRKVFEIFAADIVKEKHGSERNNVSVYATSMEISESSDILVNKDKTLVSVLNPMSHSVTLRTTLKHNKTGNETGYHGEKIIVVHMTIALDPDMKATVEIDITVCDWAFCKKDCKGKACEPGCRKNEAQSIELCGITAKEFPVNSRWQCEGNATSSEVPEQRTFPAKYITFKPANQILITRRDIKDNDSGEGHSSFCIRKVGIKGYPSNTHPCNIGGGTAGAYNGDSVILTANSYTMFTTAALLVMNSLLRVY